MRRTARRSRARVWTAAIVAGATGALVLAGCGTAPSQPAEVVAVDPPAVDAPQTGGAVLTTVPALTGRPLRPDVLVRGNKPLSPAEVRKVQALAPGSVSYASGTLRIGRTPVRVVSVDPVTFRRYAAPGTAESTPVWQVVASGGAVASHEIAKRLTLELGKDVVLTGAVGGMPMTLRLGALATTGIPGTDLIVDTSTGDRLGLSGPTSVLLHAGKRDPEQLASKVRSIAGKDADVDLLGAKASDPVAFLTGSRAARAFGAFSYTYFPDGTIQPDASWVRSSIVSARVPLLGTVTCHRLMIPQLRGALQDVAEAGLSVRTYDGCYVPRFIERDPMRSVSLHTWGIAIDLDAATNMPGSKGTMDPRIVAIFKRWGFRWGGDWSYSDPMHFEIGALLDDRP